MRMDDVEVIRDRQFGRRRDATQDVGDAEEPRANRPILLAAPVSWVRVSQQLGA